jgi:leucyl/phenylalanyl-tRNA--protein transferase
MRQYAVNVLGPDPEAPFPDPGHCDHPDGLLAVGGDLSIRRLLNAYRNGIFPWYEPGGPLLWWSPDPRAVLIPDAIHVPRRLMRTLRQQRHGITLDRDFEAVIDGCAAPRSDNAGTWITPEMRAAYVALHRAGHAHSIEVRRGDTLVGGLYGVAVGAMFYAESKFHVERDASKIALVELAIRLHRAGFILCDCQLWNPHLEQFGVRMIDRGDFLRLVRHATGLPERPLWFPSPQARDVDDRR